MLVEFECPKCKGHACEMWGLDSPSTSTRLMYWHMILNPGLAINELVLGQRFPKNLYNCKSCTTPLYERSWVHCPECDTFHSGMIWSGKNAFKHWLGMFCPSCGGEIPCLSNYTTRAVLALTKPFWHGQVERKRALLTREARKQIAMDGNALHKPREPVDFKKMGLKWGLFMYLVFTFIFPPLLALGMGEFTLRNVGIMMVISLVIGPLVWFPAGLLYGSWMKLALNKQGDENMHIAMNEDGSVAPMQIDDHQNEK